MSTSFHPLEQWLRQRFESIVGLGPVGADDDMWESGLDSMGAVELCASMSADGIGEIEPTDLLRTRTISALVDFLAVGRPKNHSPLVILNEGGTRKPIFVVPGVGGTSLPFHALAKQLGDDQPLCIVEPRGMHSLGRIERTVQERVSTLIEIVRSHLDPEDTCILIGYSLGATFALEAALQLRADGTPVHLMLIDGTLGGKNQPLGEPPEESSLRANASVSRLSVLRRATSKIRRTLNRVADPLNIRIHHLKRGKRKYNRMYYGLFKRVGVSAVLKHDLNPTSIETTVFQAANSPYRSVIEAYIEGADFHEIGGDHFSILQPPHVGLIANVITRKRDLIISGTL